ncbi:hypothetical protein GIS00_13805 [Nakamurella sp. YIM 132087]|uniref:Nitroreductase domain-containing protein n=1 Tax=Nakamurella alba TaxID=2665158 RepID=A0A7K1FQE4_9ACTN|nr:nitroreductase family protein [Nakamurella alba]MTD15014.1 hypothetical protein [Nakamurella alba]
MTPPTPVDVITTMRRRRMHREFEDRPVPREVLNVMAWGAVRAQQARPGVRHVVVVDDPAKMRAARQVLPGFINNAPAMIALCTDVDRALEALGPRGVEHVSRLDAGAAAAYLALIGQTVGIGVCTVTSWADGIAAELLGLPDHIRPDVTVAVGFVPPRTPAAVKSLKYSVWSNEFGTPMEVTRP